MSSNIDQKTLAYINMYGILGSLTVLCDIVPEAKKIIGSCRELCILHLKFDNMVGFNFLTGFCYHRKSEFWTEAKETALNEFSKISEKRVMYYKIFLKVHCILLELCIFKE